MAYYLKAPGGSVDYAVDWGAGYLDGQTVVESRWSVAPERAGGLTVAATVTGETVQAATLSGGAAGELYRVTNSVLLDDGRSDSRILTIRIGER